MVKESAVMAFDDERVVANAAGSDKYSDVMGSDGALPLSWSTAAFVRKRERWAVLVSSSGASSRAHNEEGPLRAGPRTFS